MIDGLKNVAIRNGRFLKMIVANSLCLKTVVVTEPHPVYPNMKRTREEQKYSQCDSFDQYETSDVLFHNSKLHEKLPPMTKITTTTTAEATVEASEATEEAPEATEEASEATEEASEKKKKKPKVIYYRRISTFMSDYLAKLEEILEGYWPTDEMMEVLSKLDQGLWPLNLNFVTDEGSQIIEAFKKWPTLFPNFPGPAILTEEKMLDYYNKIIDFLSDNRKSGTFWCKFHKSSPTDFWSLLLIYMKDDLGTDIQRLIKATLSCPFGSADAER